MSSDDILLPRASDHTSEAQLTSWRSANNSLVRKGEIIATFETKEISLEMEAHQTGTLIHRADEMDLVPNGQRIASIQLFYQNPEDDPPIYRPELSKTKTEEVFDKFWVMMKSTLTGLGIRYLILKLFGI